MSDKFHEQVSEFIDDEMSIEESEFFVRRLQREESARRQYLRYQLIGAAVRGEICYSRADDLASRLETALDRDSTVARRPAARWMRWASGAGIAASIVLVAWFGFRMATQGPESRLAGTGRTATSSDASPVVSEGGVALPLVGVPDQVTGIQYLLHHARYSSGMSRTIMQSNVLAAQELDLSGGGEGSSIE